METTPTYEELEAIVVQLLKDNVMLRAQLAHLLQVFQKESPHVLAVG